MGVSLDQEPSRRRLGIYTLERKIGSGAMGDVYEATHTGLQKKVALKVLRTDGVDDEMRARFLQEGVAASKVRHPNVVGVTDAGTDGEVAYLAMELLDGETLAECLRHEGRLPLTYAVDLILPVAAALDAAHQAGVLHRDMKPGNVFLAEVGRGDPEPMLLDFGISKILGPVDANLTQNPSYLGTPLYIAPEQAEGEAGSEASDQYSLALTLYECLLGFRPHEKYRSSLVKLLHAVAEADILPPRHLDPSIPPALEDALMRALARKPGDRFPSVREFGAALLPFASTARFSLWQHTFVDGERTLASSSRPISSRRGGRISVDVADLSPMAGSSSEAQRQLMAGEAHDAAGSNAAGSNAAGSSDPAGSTERQPGPDFDGSRSSVSRRGDRVGSTSTGQGGNSGGAVVVADESPAWAGVDASATSDPWDGEGRGSWRRPADLHGARATQHRWLAYLVAGFLAVSAVFATILVIRHEMASDTYDVRVRTDPPGAHLELDGQDVGSGQFHGSFRRDGTTHRLRASLPGHAPASILFRDSAPDPLVELEPLSRSAPEARSASPPATPQGRADAEAPPNPRQTPTERSESTPPATSTGTKEDGHAVSSVRRGDASSQTTAASAPGANTSSAPSDTDSSPTTSDAEAAASSSGRAGDSAPDPERRQPSLRTGNLDPWED